MNVLPPITLDFGERFGNETEAGVDFGVPVGTPIYAPAAGTVGTEDLGKADWGKRIFVHAADGMTYAVGHMGQFAVAAGQRVAAGQLIGYSGGDPSDPSSGQSTGPHVEVQAFRKAGDWLDPHGITGLFDAVFGGAVQAGQQIGAGAAPGGGDLARKLNPLSGVAAAIDAFGQLLQREFWIAAGIGLVVLGVLLLVFEDLEKAMKAVGEVAAANPEVAAA